MTALERLFQFAIHDSTTQWLLEPSASKVDVVPAVPVIFRPSPEYINIPRSDRTLPNGEFLPSLRGIKNPSLGSLEFEVDGLSASGAADGVAASGLDSAVWPLIEILAGGTADGTGGVVDPSDSGSGVILEMDVGEASGFVAGDGIMALHTANTFPSEHRCHEIVSKSVDTIHVSHNFTDAAGGTETALESGTAYAAKTAYFDNDNENRAHFAFFDETPTNRLEALGCAPMSAQLKMDHGQPMRLVLGDIKATKWTNESLLSGTYSAPATGNPIVCSPMYLWIGNTLYTAYDLTFDFGLNVVPRKSSGGPANNLGFVYKPAQPKLSGRMVIGSLTAPQQATQTLLETWGGAQNYSADLVDIGVQIGNQPTAAMYIRFPTARFTSLTKAEEDGLEVLDFSIESTENAETYDGGCRIHLF